MCRISRKSVIKHVVWRICTKMASVCITFKEYNTPYWEIRLTTCNFVDGCSHHYRFCVTFISLANLNFPRLVIPTMWHIKSHMRQHSIIFNTSFQLMCVVRNEAINIYWMKFNSPGLQECSGKEVLLYLENLHLATRWMWLQHVWAHHHFSRGDTESVNMHYERRWKMDSKRLTGVMADLLINEIAWNQDICYCKP